MSDLRENGAPESPFGRRFGHSSNIQTVALFILGVVVLLLGARDSHDPSENITTGRVSLRDDKGVIVAELGVGTDGLPSLVMFDPGGKRRLDLGLSSDGSPRARLFDANSRERLSATLSESGMPSIALIDTRGTKRGTFSMQPDESAGITLTAR